MNGVEVNIPDFTSLVVLLLPVLIVLAFIIALFFLRKKIENKVKLAIILFVIAIALSALSFIAGQAITSYYMTDIYGGGQQYYAGEAVTKEQSTISGARALGRSLLGIFITAAAFFLYSFFVLKKKP